MKKIIIAIDGFSSCGKSTLGKALAAKLEYSFIDSGAMYRAVAYYLQQNNLDVLHVENLTEVLKNIHIEFNYNPALKKSETFLNGVNIENEIRNLKVSSEASKVSANSEVRRFLVSQQQKKSNNHSGLIMDGRDIGTVVFPNAELKLFVNAAPEIRIERRLLELKSKNINCSFEEVEKDILERDHNDTTRKDSPLKKAEDAIEIDTSFLTPEEQLEKAYQLVIQKIAQISCEA